MATLGTAQLSQFTDILHDFYIPGLINQFPYEVSLWGEMTEKPVDGKRFEIRHELGTNQRARAVLERGLLPTAAGDIFDMGHDTTKYIYAPIDVTGPMLHETKGKRQFIDLVSRRFRTTSDGFIQTLDRIMWLDGSGRIARCNGTATYSGDTGLTTVTYDDGVSFNILDHMNVNFGTDTTDFEVVEVDHDGGVTFYVSGDASSYALDQAYIYNSKGYVSTLYTEPMGIKGHVNDANPPATSVKYQNMDRDATGFGWLQAKMTDNDGVITTLAMKKFIDSIRRQSHQTPNKFIMAEGVYNSWMLLMESKHQSVSMVVDKLGFNSLQYVYRGKSMKLETADRCPAGYLYALNTEFLEKRVSRQLGWITDEGNPKMRMKDDYDIFVGYMAIFYNTLCRMPRSNGALYGITEDAIA